MIYPPSTYFHFVVVLMLSYIVACSFLTSYLDWLASSISKDKCIGYGAGR